MIVIKRFIPIVFVVFFSFLILERNVEAEEKGANVIWQRNEIENEARWLVKKGRYEEAILKFREATNPAILNHDYEASTARGLIFRLLNMHARFDEALQELQYFIKGNPNGTGWVDAKLEIDALMESRATNSSEPVLKYIQYLKEKYQKDLPPKGVRDSVATTIMRLYDYIGDYDEGIKFVESFLIFYQKIGPGNPYQPANPYFQVKQAFLEDKKENRKSFVGAPPGTCCIGRATKAIIHSNYFPW